MEMKASSKTGGYVRQTRNHQTAGHGRGYVQHGCPEDQHSRVSSTIFNAVLAATNLMPIQVDITYYNVRMRREDDELMALRDQPVTNNESSCSWELPNEGWEQVHRDGLEAKGESLSCVICMEEYGTVGDDQSVTRLPCLHLCHGHCILDWLMDRANNSESQTCVQLLHPLFFSLQ
ncbi:hypothetical protein ACLB2K_042203 [Fragaria x ananassa]